MRAFPTTTAPFVPASLASERERRRAPRFRRKSRAELIVYPPGRHAHAFEVAVVDYSATGIGIVHTEGLLIGQRFIVRAPSLTQHNTCLFTVARSDPRPDGTWSIGLHVGNTLEEELTPLLQEKPAPGITLKTKLAFLAFAIVGAASVVMLALHYHHQ